MVTLLADPVEFRLRHLSDPRGRAVIEAASRKAGWRNRGRVGSAGSARGLGIGFAKYKNLGAYCAVVAEVEVEREVRVRRLWIAVDVGLVVNPDGVVNQIEGGAVQATSWTLKEEVKFSAEGIACQGWEDYPILKFSEVPAVEVQIISRPDQKSVGAGEAPWDPRRRRSPTRSGRRSACACATCRSPRSASLPRLSSFGEAKSPLQHGGISSEWT